MTGDSVGERIRAVRSERGLSLRALSARAEVSIGLLSQAERGVTDPSLQSLRAIARALDVPLFDLFQPPDEAAVSVVRRDQRLGLSAPHGEITYGRISPGAGKLEVLEGVLQPGGASSSELWSHASEECVLVTEGSLTLEVGSETHTLQVGDSCYFDSHLPHRYCNPGDERVVFIVSITPPSY